MPSFMITGGHILSGSGGWSEHATYWEWDGITPGTLLMEVLGSDALTGDTFAATTVAAAPSGFTPTVNQFGTLSWGGSRFNGTLSIAGASRAVDDGSSVVALDDDTTLFDIQTLPVSLLATLLTLFTFPIRVNKASALIIIGDYEIVIYTWWFNAALNQFETSDTDPGAGWELADPTPGDPTPAITSVASPETVVDGVTAFPDGYVAPAAGCAGTVILIQGTGFGNNARVIVGGVEASAVVVVDQNAILATVGAHADGIVDVAVLNTDGGNDTFPNAFEYVTPWWVETLTFEINGQTVSYDIYRNQCVAPATGTQTRALSAPGFLSVPDGWFASPSAFGGDVVVIANGTPRDPRSWADIATWATGGRAMLGGSPAAAAVIRNRLIYPGTDYSVGTDDPPIRVFDGSFEHKLCSVPPAAAGASQAVMSMLAANGTVYLTTFDSGTTSADWLGRVFSLDLDSAVLTPIGSAFAAGELPYALCWHMGRLWCGTTNGIGTVGKVYYFRPGIDTAWTLDHSLATESLGGVVSLASFQGKLYVGSDNAAGSFAKILVRDSAGAYTVSDTGTGGTAKINNGFLAMREFDDALYASFWNNDSPTRISKIRKFDGSTWSTVYNGASGTLRPFIVLFVDDAKLFGVAGGFGLTGAIVRTPDGTTWTDLTGQLPEDDRTLLPVVGVELL
jgi:hypothetical protein